MRIFLHANRYASHARVAADYAQVLQRAGHAIVRDPSIADVWFIHDEPHAYAALFDRLPKIKRWRIGFAVYEATPLPQEYVRGVALVDELWVPSEFCRTLFAPHHPRVRVVPHLVYRTADADHAVCDAFALQKDKRRLLHIARGFDRRKGTEQLLRVFAMLHKNDPRLELLVKGTPQDQRIIQAGVVHIRLVLTPEQITALYLASHAYVSPHRGEGWGLTLSDALALGRRAVATDWSGNVDFMRQADGSASALSILLPVSVASIRERDCFGFFRADQKWAYVSDDDLAAALTTVLSLPQPSQDELARERQSLSRFSPQAVLEKIQAVIGGWPKP